MSNDLLKAGRGKKDNSRRKKVPEQMLEQRREEAQVRQAAYSKLTPKQKLAKLDAGKFVAKRQRARIAAEMTIQKGAVK